MKNCFSIDVEGFLESNEDSFGKQDIRHDEDREIRINTETVLDLLDETQTKATFFILGRIARDIPEVVRSIASRGHEIGCHGYYHTRLFNLSREQALDGIGNAKKMLEDVSGKQVYGFRAPDFSITKKNYYVIDLLRELGFVYDSSIYPFGYHDVYGIKDASKHISTFDNGLIEFPMSTVTVLNKTLPFGGGGYFRLYPIALTRHLIRRSNRNNMSCMVYQHPYEIGPSIPRVKNLSAYRRFRHYHNCGNGYKRTKRLLRSFEFCQAINIVRGIN